MKENGEGRRGDDLVAEGWVQYACSGMKCEGRDPETSPSRHLVDTRGPNSHEIQQKMAVPNTEHHER